MNIEKWNSRLAREMLQHASRVSLIVLSAWFGLITARAQVPAETVLHQFNPSQNDGASPYSGLVQGADGWLYGTTWDGGTNAQGTVFRMARDGGNYSILHHFGSSNDGSTTDAGLVQANNGMLYGTTFYGGTNNFGTVFAININGSAYSVLYSFTNSPDGANPRGGLIQGFDGALYGTTEIGGSNHQGTVFKINLDGSGYSILHTFTNFGDATEPFAGLVQASNGMLYGTTYSGGANLIGTVFTISTNGNSYSILHPFGGPKDGHSLESPLLLATDGWLYGTSVSGGTNGYGTVFKINTNGGGYAVLRSFTNSPDGANPYGGLAQGSDGALYGVTTYGGVTNSGTIFRLNTDGSGYSVLYSFSGNNGDGANPFASMIATSNGVFYGTTLDSGTSESFGTVFRFSILPSLGLSLSNVVPTITLTGFAGQPCQIQVSSNLIDWDLLANLSLTNGSAKFTDSAAAALPARFYRALVQ